MITYTVCQGSQGIAEIRRGPINRVNWDGPIIGNYCSIRPYRIARWYDGSYIIADHRHGLHRLCKWTEGMLEAEIIDDPLGHISSIVIDPYDRIIISDAVQIKRYDIHQKTMSVVLGFFPDPILDDAISISSIAMDERATLYLLDKTGKVNAGGRLTRWEAKEQGFDSGQILSDGDIDAFCLLRESKMAIARNGMVMICNIGTSRINDWGDPTPPTIAITVERCIGYHADCAGLSGINGSRIYSWTKKGMGFKRHDLGAFPMTLSTWNDIGLQTPCYHMSASRYIPWTAKGKGQRKCKIFVKGQSCASLLAKIKYGINTLPPSIIDNMVGFMYGNFVPAHFS